MIKVKNISKKLGSFKLNNISFSVNEGDYFVILGKSGAGKTVLLEIISGLITPDSGTIFLNDADITYTKIQKRNIGLVFQNHSLFPHLTIKNNILYPVRAKHLFSGETFSKLTDLAATLKITHLLNKKPGTLSIGESQRVALARTLITSPQCILLDEPLSSLDAQTKAKTKSLLRKVNKMENYIGSNNISKNNVILNHSLPVKKQTIIHVTHDYEEAISLATKIAVIENGTISQCGTPEEVFRHPKTTFIANFIGIKNFYKGELLIKKDSALFIPYTKEEKSKTKIYVSTSEKSGFGSLIIRSEDITISNIKNESSARNSFKGKIIDIENVRTGIEITVKVNDIKISALITKTSFDKLKLDYNKNIYMSFKASAVKFLRG